MLQTVPICYPCWTIRLLGGSREPERIPVRLIDPDIEWCHYCGDEATDGIYVREDVQEEEGEPHGSK